MKASELQGVALDWAVAKCEGLLTENGGNLKVFGNRLATHASSLGTTYTPLTDWSQGGPIIEREGLTITHHNTQWAAQTDNDLFAYGPTPLIAAMRCYVASQLGNEIDIPNELMETTK